VEMKYRLPHLPSVARLTFLAILSLPALSLEAHGQQQNPPANPPVGQEPQSGNAGKNSQDSKTQDPATGTTNDRLFYAIPNFLTVENAGKVPALTSKQKFKLVARDSFDYFNYPWFGFLAGISQAGNSEAGYGQGAQGYAKRYGSTFADGTIENFTTGAVFPSLFHQDPRYYQLGEGRFTHRAGYAVSRIFVTRTDSSRSQFNYSEVVGAAVAAGISNAYHPAGDRTVGNTMSVWATDMGWDTFIIVVKEFWPDIRRKLGRNKN
jgi:hypothetical protein